jgi:hypothetical protein
MRHSVPLDASALFSAACSAVAQPATPAREFAVASIKPQSGPMRNIGVYIEVKTLKAYACREVMPQQAAPDGAPVHLADRPVSPKWKNTGLSRHAPYR